MPSQTLTRDEKETVQQDAMPVARTAPKRRRSDLQASWIKRHGESNFDQWRSTSMGLHHRLASRGHISTTSEYVNLHIEGLLEASSTSSDIWADRGCIEREREQRLGERGWPLHILLNDQAGKPLSGCQVLRNRDISKTRARVECIYASLEEMGGKALRSIRLGRATLPLH